MADPLAGESPPVSSWSENPVYHALRTYLAFVMNLFGELEGTEKKDWAWSSDPQKTRINIGSVTPMDAKQIAGRPAIIVTGQDAMPTGGIIGSFDDLNPLTGELKYLELFQSSLAAYALSRSPVEAHDIAWFLAESTWALHRTLIANGGFYRIGFGIRIGPVLPPGNLVGGDLRGPIHTVPLIIPYAFVRRTSVRPINAPKLNHINLHLRPQGKTLDHVADSPPPGWTVEKWITEYNANKGYQPPSDPSNIPPPLPTEEGPGRQSVDEVVVRVDLVE